jgi:hypothetical protein
MRQTPFSIGRRWRCTRDRSKPITSPDFDFVIIGPGRTKTSKRCRIESHDPSHHRSHHGAEADYSHKHLKKHAKLVEEESHG